MVGDKRKLDRPAEMVQLLTTIDSPTALRSPSCGGAVINCSTSYPCPRDDPIMARRGESWRCSHFPDAAHSRPSTGTVCRRCDASEFPPVHIQPCPCLVTGRREPYHWLRLMSAVVHGMGRTGSLGRRHSATQCPGRGLERIREPTHSCLLVHLPANLPCSRKPRKGEKGTRTAASLEHISPANAIRNTTKNLAWRQMSNLPVLVQDLPVAAVPLPWTLRSGGSGELGAAWPPAGSERRRRVWPSKPEPRRGRCW